MSEKVLRPAAGWGSSWGLAPARSVVLTAALNVGLTVALTVALAVVPIAAAQQDDAATRTEIIVGALVPQPERYFQDSNSSAPNLVSNEDLARIVGIPVRQHPVNAGVFATGCAQCHRLAGPLPPDSGAPEDVFDRLPVETVSTPAPAGFTRLTTSTAREEYPAWSPDGGQILFEARDEAGRYNLWLVGADGAAARQVTDHVSAGWASWNPDGRRIVYWASDAAGSGDLWLLDLADGSTVQLTHHRMTAWPQWSPDGSVVAYQARDDAGWALYLLDVATGAERDLLQLADALPSRPLWSPDGSQLLYQSLVGTRFELTRLLFPLGPDGRPDLAAEPMRVATTTGYPIDLGAATQHPAWNPAGNRIAYVMYTLQVVPPGTLAFSYKTWTIAPDGTSPSLLVPFGTLADRSPTWNRAGTWLAQWSWNQDLRAAVWLVNAAATERVELTAGLGGDALYPAWSPDGTRIAFASNREGTFDIWVAEVAALVGASAGGR